MKYLPKENLPAKKIHGENAGLNLRAATVELKGEKRILSTYLDDFIASR